MWTFSYVVSVKEGIMHTHSGRWIAVMWATLGSGACQGVVSSTHDASLLDTGPRVTDSVVDFSLIQGNGRWRYLYQEPGEPLKELTDIHGMMWWMNYETRWTNIGTDFMHPNVHGKPNALGNFVNMGVQYPVRRWTADVAGTADIDYAVAKANTLCGDGVVTRILVDDVELVEHTIAFNDDAGFGGTLHATVLVGSNVDLLLEGGANEDCDGTRFTAKIVVH